MPARRFRPSLSPCISSLLNSSLPKVSERRLTRISLTDQGVQMAAKIVSALKAGRFPSGDCEGQPVSAPEPPRPRTRLFKRRQADLLLTRLSLCHTYGHRVFRTRLGNSQSYLKTLFSPFFALFDPFKILLSSVKWIRWKKK
jgi:hypothetical protein